MRTERGLSTLHRWGDRIEVWFLGALLGAVLPIVGLLAGWWGSVPLLPERYIPFAAAGGVLAGVLVDVLWLRRWVRRAYALDLRIWAAVYLFYSVCLLGFFMGVPVFHVALGVPAGLLIGGRLAREMAPPARVRRTIRRASAFTVAVLAVVCAASAAVALIDPYTGSSLQGMLGLRFEVTRAMIVAIVVVGGALLLVAQWWITALSAWFVIRVRPAAPLP
jgi:hypothetical protein